jgi:hypothetical protein
MGAGKFVEAGARGCNTNNNPEGFGKATVENHYYELLGSK